MSFYLPPGVDISKRRRRENACHDFKRAGDGHGQISTTCPYHAIAPFDDNNLVAYEPFIRPAHSWNSTSSVGVDPVALGLGFYDVIDGFSKTPDFTTFAVGSPSEYSSFSQAPSTISRDSPSSSVCSTIQPDCPSELTKNQGPRQLHNPTSQREASRPCTRGKSNAEENAVAKNRHVCLWGAARKKCASFATREELNRHVKVEHLLECPMSGCTESYFQTRELLDCHIKCDHGPREPVVSQTMNPLGAGPETLHNAPSTLVPAEKTVTSRHNNSEERLLKMEMETGISKKRCRENLETVINKRARRENGLPKSADSIGSHRGRAPTMESVGFPLIWEHGILPFLIEFMPKWCGPGHAITVMRGKKPNMRRICIMTTYKVKRVRRMIIAGHVRDLLPEAHRNLVTFVFSMGKVDRLVWARGLGKQMPDEVCDPRNPFAYISPCMGDSIGASLEDGEDATATLGPCVMTEHGSYWLASFHPFIGTRQRTSPVLIEHPSPQDRALCTQENHEALEDMKFDLGMMTATSGFDLKTTRITHNPYWDDYDKEPPLVVTDWILISSGDQQANLLREFPKLAQHGEGPITSTSSVMPGASVISTGRSSGLQKGQICEIPAYVDGAINGTEKATREWFIEEPDFSDDEDAWIRGGIGVEGDSGAAIIERDTNNLVGQLWGRNAYWGPGPRITYFTPISDVFDDIQEKCRMSSRPRLPQDRNEANPRPIDPVCRQCYEIHLYRSSRRSSKVSFMSMIGGAHEGRGELDNDLTSVSELATPRGHIDSSFPSNVSAFSPVPINSFSNLSQAPSPAVAEMPTLYPQELNDEDLYDSDSPRPNELTLGKRQAILPAAKHANKRRRVTSTDLG